MNRFFSGRIALAAPLAAAAAAAVLQIPAQPVRAQGAPSMFGMGELDGQRFILVAAPIGSGSRSQLNIYEQIHPRRSCFAVAEGRPAVVNPLLATFDFTGICGRYIDANGFSLRIGDQDLATVYRLSIVPTASDIHLMALPTKGTGPELVVARTQGLGTGFLKLEFEPGWRLGRRQFRGRSLGHVYVYRDTWPAAESAASASQPTGAGASDVPSIPAPPPAPSPR